jgi:RNA polymerase sigma-70 factor (ECF subfamily)
VTEDRDFAAFYAATFSSLCAQLYVHVGNLDEAQDLVQEAFTRALPRWSQLAEYDDPAAWVRKVAWNLATSRWRRARAFTNFAVRHREKHVPPPTADRVVLRNALAKLPRRQRQAVVLHYLADASIAEIARLTNAPENTVKTWLHRGRAALAGLLDEGVTLDV